MQLPEEAHRDPETVCWVERRLIQRDGTRSVSTKAVLREHCLDITIQGRLTMRLVCTPQYLRELVLGRLCSEGIIRSVDEVSALSICRQGSLAQVTLTEGERGEETPFVEVTPTAGTDSHIFTQRFVRYGQLAALPPLAWRAEQVFALADLFQQGTPLHRQTWAAHSCILARGEQVLFQCEDIGRHNALDKAIGYALSHGIDLHGCMAYSSGRIAADMAVKAVRAGIPLLASKAAPTREAIELARTWGLTLIGGARQDQMQIYT